MDLVMRTIEEWMPCIREAHVQKCPKFIKHRASWFCRRIHLTLKIVVKGTFIMGLEQNRGLFRRRLPVKRKMFRAVNSHENIFLHL
ncbi:hypothetical protein CEXT_744571 [Caerostris extrusa]|uniref:Uncharacterized protein n=1 Tax=Caerostris extrusa TaxID=172846 RepID=A0AAV4MIF1_CAEEX|nr:hypothetical protein CEXT_744571 [Caerostris extrusa]